MPGNHKHYCLQGGSRSWEFGYIAKSWSALLPKCPGSSSSRRSAGRGKTLLGKARPHLVRKYTDLWGLRPETTTAYLCGHPSRCENGEGLLQRAGWLKGSMFEEVYFIPAKEASAEYCDLVDLL
jgi:hypothetical protein